MVPWLELFWVRVHTDPAQYTIPAARATIELHHFFLILPLYLGAQDLSQKLISKKEKLLAYRMKKQ